MGGIWILWLASGRLLFRRTHKLQTRRLNGFVSSTSEVPTIVALMVRIYAAGNAVNSSSPHIARYRQGRVGREDALT